MLTHRLHPRVTIGLPVFNGEAYLRQALDSILAQELRDFEVILSDNGSTDGTEAIGREYAARDRRVRYERHDVNRGAAWNFNHVFHATRTAFFMWMAHDDMIEPGFLARACAVLESDPTAAICYSNLRVIDAAGRLLRDYDFKLPSDARDAFTRFHCLVHADHKEHLATEIFGLMRTELLRHTPLMQGYAHSDRCLLVRLARYGRFVQLQDHLVLHRSHATQSMRTLPAHVVRGRFVARLSRRLADRLGTGPLPPAEWFDPRRQDRIAFPDWRRAGEYFAIALYGPHGGLHKLRCLLTAAAWAARNAPRLLRDVVAAADQLLARTLPRRAEVAPAAVAAGSKID